MNLGERIYKFRTAKNMSQGDLADALEVSRQSVSKWESDLAFPETEKLIRISELFDCSLDYLLRDKDDSTKKSEPAPPPARSASNRFWRPIEERKSEKTVGNLPLWHIADNAHGFIAVGKKARGIIAIGLGAVGVVSIGLASVGIFSFGLIAVGLLALGCLSVGGVSLGTIAVGLLSFGSISIGIIAIGAISIGEASFGALAIGRYFAVGDRAEALIAFGKSESYGRIYSRGWGLTWEQQETVRALIKKHLPGYLQWLWRFVGRI